VKASLETTFPKFEKKGTVFEKATNLVIEITSVRSRYERRNHSRNPNDM